MKTTVVATVIAFAGLCLPAFAVPLALAGAEPEESIAWNLIATETSTEFNGTSLEKRAGFAYWTAYSGNTCENDTGGTRLGVDQGKSICSKTSGRHSFLAENYGCPGGLWVTVFDQLGCTGSFSSGRAPHMKCVNVNTGRAWNSAQIECRN